MQCSLIKVKCIGQKQTVGINSKIYLNGARHWAFLTDVQMEREHLKRIFCNLVILFPQLLLRSPGDDKSSRTFYAWFHPPHFFEVCILKDVVHTPYWFLNFPQINNWLHTKASLPNSIKDSAPTKGPWTLAYFVIREPNLNKIGNMP